ncbi:hypothetical protein FIBSPDRAFT_877394 [Athelia psychrophila]|uniref:Uncharacterized protein n=1 Tax=Athelia psychrophila TaxID=1759441 RepID=A0A167W1A0_9AGAM|nr:hypothetical protein FIBSPDRAFT_877394 [Fibularhizoctonia sp. CBS 109695]
MATRAARPVTMRKSPSRPSHSPGTSQTAQASYTLSPSSCGSSIFLPPRTPSLTHHHCKKRQDQARWRISCSFAVGHIQHRPSACSNSARSPVHIVTPDWIKHGASLVRGNMLWKEEYAPFEVDEGESRT